MCTQWVLIKQPWLTETMVRMETDAGEAKTNLTTLKHSKTIPGETWINGFEREPTIHYDWKWWSGKTNEAEPEPGYNRSDRGKQGKTKVDNPCCNRHQTLSKVLWDLGIIGQLTDYATSSNNFALLMKGASCGVYTIPDQACASTQLMQSRHLHLLQIVSAPPTPNPTPLKEITSK